MLRVPDCFIALSKYLALYALQKTQQPRACAHTLRALVSDPHNCDMQEAGPKQHAGGHFERQVRGESEATPLCLGC